MIKTILFDLDGTLADTAPDLSNALNEIRQIHSKPKLSFDTIRPTVSLGGNAMIELAFGLKEGDENFEVIRNQFLEQYLNNIAHETQLFDGMEDVIRSIEADKRKWGIVTNKTSWLTDPLVKELELDQRAACVVSGDTTPYRKPHPAPLLHACELTQSDPAKTVYIGDAERDIEAGRRAGTKTLIAMYGYISEDETPADWQADGMIDTPYEIEQRLSEFND